MRRATFLLAALFLLACSKPESEEPAQPPRVVEPAPPPSKPVAPSGPPRFEYVGRLQGFEILEDRQNGVTCYGFHPGGWSSSPAAVSCVKAYPNFDEKLAARAKAQP